MEIVMECLEGIQKSSVEYFVHLSKVCDGALMVMKELETEIISWKKEEPKWATKVV